MEPLNRPAAVREQYRTADKLSTRISIHDKYSVNRQGFHPWIASHYRIPEGAALLELGCGTGSPWKGQEGIIRKCARFVLSDLSEGMLEKAKETLKDVPGIEYRLIDITDIPFSDESFDAVIANMMLYHVPDLDGALREVRRVLKKDGSFYCATYGENGMTAYLAGLFKEYPVDGRLNDTFTLENGEAILRRHFSEVQRLLYEDALAVTDVDDMVDYIFSLSGFSALRRLPRKTVRSVLEAHKTHGILQVPKEYGLFIARGKGEELIPR